MSGKLLLGRKKKHTGQQLIIYSLSYCVYIVSQETELL